MKSPILLFDTLIATWLHCALAYAQDAPTFPAAPVGYHFEGCTLDAATKQWNNCKAVYDGARQAAPVTAPAYVTIQCWQPSIFGGYSRYFTVPYGAGCPVEYVPPGGFGVIVRLGGHRYRYH